MVVTTAIVLVMFWVLGVTSANTMGGLVHLLLVAAAAMVIAKVAVEWRPL